MRKLILIVHTSLDGFVAGPAGELDGFPSGEENLEFICRLTRAADAALFGRVTFQLLNSDWPNKKDRPDATWNEVAYSCWYNTAQKIVVSKTLQDGDAPTATIIRGDVIAAVKKLKEEPGKQVLLFGSPMLSQALMRHRLIDEYRVFLNPVVFGAGIPLFSGGEAKASLQLLNTKTFANGEIALHYAVGKPAE